MKIKIFNFVNVNSVFDFYAKRFKFYAKQYTNVLHCLKKMH